MVKQIDKIIVTLGTVPQPVDQIMADVGMTKKHHAKTFVGLIREANRDGYEIICTEFDGPNYYHHTPESNRKAHEIYRDVDVVGFFAKASA